MIALKHFQVWCVEGRCIHLSFWSGLEDALKVCRQWYFERLRLIMSGCLCVFLEWLQEFGVGFFPDSVLSHFINGWVLFCLLVNNSLFESVSGMVYRWSSYPSFTRHVTARVNPGFVVSQSGNHQENNLAKFGYVLEQNRILLCFWLLTGT
jgi:hypothetical protein